MDSSHLDPDLRREASGLLYSMAKQGTYGSAIRRLLAERGLTAAHIDEMFERYRKEERTAARFRLSAGAVLFCCSVGLTAYTLSSGYKGDYVRVWPWGLVIFSLPKFFCGAQAFLASGNWGLCWASASGKDEKNCRRSFTFRY